MKEKYVSIIERVDGEEIMELAAAVSAEVLGQVVDCVGSEGMKGVNVDVAAMQDELAIYLAECEVAEGCKIDQVAFKLIDCRKEVGLALVAVRVVPGNLEEGKDDGYLEMLGSRDVESPTIAFTLSGNRISEVHFPTKDGEMVTALSGAVPVFDASYVNEPSGASKARMIGTGIGLESSFEAPHKVGAFLPVLDQEALDASGLANKARVRDLDLIGTVSMSRYVVR